MLSVRYLTYSQFHNKNPVVGSTYIRVDQLMKYWPEAELYRYGENPDVLVFQKVYCSDDYQFPRHFENIKILDICDPDWLEGLSVAEMARAMDAITVPTEELAKFMRQLTDSPVYVVPDRWDVRAMKSPREHRVKAKTVAWFGYSHNADTLKPAIRTINELGLNLLLISNDDPILHRFDTRPKDEYYTFKKFSQDTIDGLLRTADFAILPGDYRPIGRFKSNNKTTKAILNGLPVATTGEELRAFVEPEARQKYMLEHYDTIKEEYDVRKSVAQMKEIIAEAQKARNG
jgi:hypothetical protein